MTRPIFTAELPCGDILITLSMPGMDEFGFREFVLNYLSQNSIPNPDDQLTDIDLCRWTDETYAAWLGKIPPAGESWPSLFKAAKFDELHWSYPGEWVRVPVTTMPIELAREFGDEVDSYPPDDPKSEGYHDRAVAAWDGREK